MTQRKKQLPPEMEVEDINPGPDPDPIPGTPPGPEGYKPPPGEKHLTHIEIDQETGYNMLTGEKLSTPRVIKGEEKELKSFMETAPKLGYKIKILYAPNRKG